MTTAGDLALVASRLSRAADKAEQLVAEATPGPWCFYGGDLWTGSAETLAAYDADPENVEWPYDDLGPLSGHLFRGDPGRPADAEFIAAFDPRTVAALVLPLRRAAALARAGATHGADRTGDTLTGYLAAFAALLLGEEETG